MKHLELWWATASPLQYMAKRFSSVWGDGMQWPRRCLHRWGSKVHVPLPAVRRTGTHAHAAAGSIYNTGPETHFWHLVPQGSVKKLNRTPPPQHQPAGPPWHVHMGVASA